MIWRQSLAACAHGSRDFVRRSVSVPHMPTLAAVFTGTFDPITLGHLDVIRRGRLLFEHLVVGIGVNVNKASLFNVDERVEMARLVVLRPFPNVSVESFEGLTVHFVRRIGARVILRGLRTLSDMEYEFGMTLTNHRLDPDGRDGLLDGRRRVLARFEHAGQAGGVLRRHRSAQKVRSGGAGRSDPLESRSAINCRDRGEGTGRATIAAGPGRVTRRISCSALTALNDRSKLE